MTCLPFQNNRISLPLKLAMSNRSINGTRRHDRDFSQSSPMFPGFSIRLSIDYVEMFLCQCYISILEAFYLCPLNKVIQIPTFCQFI